jgi:cation diffusion facilitator CzcD-associated flavoprotein CzcO
MKRIVIIGAGFAGLAAAKASLSLCSKGMTGTHYDAAGGGARQWADKRISTLIATSRYEQ